MARRGEEEIPIGVLLFESGNLDSAFPQLPEQSCRDLYVDTLSPEVLQELKQRGYNPIFLSSLPRKTAEEKLVYLRAKLQAVEEGTVSCTKAQLKALEVALKEAGMLEKNKPKEEKPQQLPSTVLGILTNWGHAEGQHPPGAKRTLKGNSTVRGADLILPVEKD